MENGKVIRHAVEMDRVRANTWHEVNERLDAEAAFQIQTAAQGRTDITARIGQLDREWDMDRVVETEGSLMGLLGLALAVTVHRGFLGVPGLVAAMLVVHGTHGWYPLLPVFRRLGIRSQFEIDREKYALKVLRGDFDGLNASDRRDSGMERARAAWQAVCR